MAETYIEGRYEPAGARAARRVEEQVQHLKARFRPDEAREERRLFGPDGDLADQATARALLMAAIGPKVAFHRVILSPAPRAGLIRLVDLHAWTRAILLDLSRELGQRLVWVAAVHRNAGTPHVHVLIAGAAERMRWPRKGAIADVELRRRHYGGDGFLVQRADARAAEIRARNDGGTAA